MRLLQVYDAQQGGRQEEAAELRADPKVSKAQQGRVRGDGLVSPQPRVDENMPEISFQLYRVRGSTKSCLGSLLPPVYHAWSSCFLEKYAKNSLLLNIAHVFLSHANFDWLTHCFMKAHLRTVDLRIAELERAVGTFSAKGSAGGGGSEDDPADVEQRLVDLFKEKWARAAAERYGTDETQWRGAANDIYDTGPRTESLTFYSV